MRRNEREDDDRTKSKGRKPSRKSNQDSRNKRRNSRDDRDKCKESSASLEVGDRNNDPNWYFLDKAVADQVSQLAFQQLADMPVNLEVANWNGSVMTRKSQSMEIASILSVYINPAPGVQLDSVYTGSTLQRSAINLAGFRLRSKLAAYTGRTTPYGPQDISTMILYMGEIISMIEWCRRAFGVCYTMNMYNRAYPKRILEAMSIDADDLFTNYSSYRTRFNAVVTRVNQVPIPKSVAYFDKCASLYERVYLDDESPMAQTIVYNPATTWRLDETSYSGGTILKTQTWCQPYTGGGPLGPQHFNVYMTILENMVDDLMSSSTFDVVYTDLLNLATKMKLDFWKFDYLLDGYILYPEYNKNALLMLHNATFTRVPTVTTLVPTGVTPYNDVYPNPSNNALFYNPGFSLEQSIPRIPTFQTIIDSIDPLPGVEDRIEMLKFTSMANGAIYTDSSSNKFSINSVLPDHYLTNYALFFGNGTKLLAASSIITQAQAAQYDAAWSHIDWAPITYTYDNDGTNYYISPFVHGDLNFYTLIDVAYLRKVVDFTGFGLYDVRE